MARALRVPDTTKEPTPPPVLRWSRSPCRIKGHLSHGDKKIRIGSYFSKRGGVQRQQVSWVPEAAVRDASQEGGLTKGKERTRAGLPGVESVTGKGWLI